MMRPHGPNCWNGDGAFKLLVRLEKSKKKKKFTKYFKAFKFKFLLIRRLRSENNNLGTRSITFNDVVSGEARTSEVTLYGLKNPPCLRMFSTRFLRSFSKKSSDIVHRQREHTQLNRSRNLALSRYLQLFHCRFFFFHSCFQSNNTQAYRPVVITNLPYLITTFDNSTKISLSTHSNQRNK